MDSVPNGCSLVGPCVAGTCAPSRCGVLLKLILVNASVGCVSNGLQALTLFKIMAYAALLHALLLILVLADVGFP